RAARSARVASCVSGESEVTAMLRSLVTTTLVVPTVARESLAGPTTSSVASAAMNDERDAPPRLWALPSWLVSRVALNAGRIVTARLDTAGVKRKHFSVMVALEDAGPTSQAALGRRLALDRSDL